MRDIKFRAWNGIKFYEPLYAGGCWFRDGRSLEDGNTTNDHVMQYTGLKDNLGAHIFEGDILRVSNDDYHETADYEVIYCADDGYPAFELKGFISDSNSFSEVINSGLYYYLVAGNIYSNQELLGE